MKFPQLLICILLYPFIFSQLAIAQKDQVYLDSKYILLGENYTLISYDAANDVLASTILTPNYNSPKSAYFIYTVEGLLHDGTTTVEKTGTFLLLQ